jgi:TolB-like protein
MTAFSFPPRSDISRVKRYSQRLKRRIAAAVCLFFSAGLSVSASLKHLDRAADTIAGEVLARMPKEGASVAVLPFRSTGGETSQLGRLVADGLTGRLVRSGKCTTLDRNYVSAMLEEIKLGMTGLTDQKTALQVGKFSGARYMLVGTLEPYGTKRMVVQARLLETETANLLATGRAVMEMDKGLWEMYARRAGMDRTADGFFKDEPVSDDAVFLNQDGPGGCRWVEARAEVPLEEKDPEAARASAVTLARQKAVTRVLGSAPGSSPDFAEGAFQGRIENAIRAMRSGRVLEEKIIDDRAVGLNHRIVLQACVKPAKNPDGFRVDLMLNQNRFTEGQEARAILLPTQDSFLYLYSVDFDQNALLVYPLPGMSAEAVGAGRHFVFPDDAHRAAGIRLTAQLPPGADKSIETLRVVAVRRDARKLLDGVTTYPEVVKRLEGAGEEWAEDVRLFTIYKK